jgi:glutamyl-tRNA synthetase
MTDAATQNRFHSIGRLAPSPTGAQHIGNARTFLVAWLDARNRGGRLLLRVEDLDTPRTKAWATEQAVEDLQWLGLDWDAVAPMQSDRGDRYQTALSWLREREHVYPCTCSRSEIENSASAPHERMLDGAIYPGTCAHRTARDAPALESQGIRFAWRFRMPEGTSTWVDLLQGPQTLAPKQALGDFVVARNYGPTAYQLAVVVDDFDQSITHVVRGDDLVYSTYRQNALFTALGWTSPEYMHVPLVVGPDGKRLAKRHGDTRLSLLREQQVAPESLLGQLAHSLCLTPNSEPISAPELLELSLRNPDWRQRIPHAPWVYDPREH